jgi:ureidoacrylate peracid hydrolase
MKFVARDAALILVDLQQGFCGSRPGRRDAAVLRPALASAARIVPVARAAGLPVVFTRMSFAPDYSDGGLLTAELRPGLKRKNHLRRDTVDAEIMPELGPLMPGDLLLDKQRYSAVINTSLVDWLKAGGRSSVVVAGVTTGMCVESTVRDLAQRDFRVFVVDDACADFDPANHRRVMDTFALAFGRVVSEKDIVAALQAGTAEFPIDQRFDF